MYNNESQIKSPKKDTLNSALTKHQINLVNHILINW
jgi:hypothetical protein